MDINTFLQEIIKDITNKIKLSCVMQFGSSTYSKDPRDIDLVLFSKEKVLKTREIISLIQIIKENEKENKDIVFDFGGLDRKRDSPYKITLIFLASCELQIEHNPHDLFFLKNLTEDKTIRILYGKNPLRKLKIELSNKHLLEMLSVDLKHTLRKSLDDEKYKLEAIYALFKTFLRAMLINFKIFKKNELLNNFKSKYGKLIALPTESNRILQHNLETKDFEEILIFCERCLDFLVIK
ncbi:hypothetical protein HYW75_02515 [Candidatus Pacearchaeota archaeon]|nr:hypothetical protein [Candidatus Pacearchaeota archaeon]